MPTLSFNTTNSALLSNIINENPVLASCFPFFSTEINSGGVSWWDFDTTKKRLSRVRTTWLEFCLEVLPTRFNHLLLRKGHTSYETLLPVTATLLSESSDMDIVTHLDLLIQDRIGLLN